MRSLLSLLIAFCIPATLLFATDPPRISPEQQELVTLTKSLGDAANRRDYAAWSRYVADDCIFSDEDGVVLTKAQLMEHLKTVPTEYEFLRNEQGQVTVYTYDRMDGQESMSRRPSDLHCSV